MADRIVGQTEVFLALFRDADGDLADPTTVTFTFQEPSEAPTVWVYGTDIEVERISEGQYSVSLPITAAGTWPWVFQGTGAVDAIEDGAFRARVPIVSP